MQIFSKAIPEFLFWLIDVCWKSIGELREPHAYCFRFSKAASQAYWWVSDSGHNCENTF